MKKTILFSIICLIALLAIPAWMMPDEGMWLMTQVQHLPIKQMKKTGLKLSAEEIYSSKKTSLVDAIVLLPGGTGSFVSSEGLIVTNHHIAFGAIQSVSSVEEDYLKNGFVARTKEEEISVPSYTANIVREIRDVTSEVLSAVSDTMNVDARAKAIRAKINEMQQAEKTKTGDDYTVSETFNGVKYILYRYQTLTDIRLVYAPPSAIGNYGGEVDNWYWPRHTGDFGFLRAYVGKDGKAAKYSKENVPFKSTKFLPVSKQPIKENDFAMIMGFPGRTFRYRTAAEIQLARDEALPLSMEIFKKRMDIIEAAGKNDRATEIKYSSVYRRIANTYKNYQGTLEGMKHADILNLRHKDEEELKKFLASKPELEHMYGTVLDDIAKVYADLKTFNKKQVVLSQLVTGVDLYRIAARLNTLAASSTADSSGRMKLPEGMLSETSTFIISTFKNYNANVDKQTLAALLLAAADLPEGQRAQSVQQIVGTTTGAEREQRINNYVERLYTSSALTNQEACLRLMTLHPDTIRSDEFLKFYAEFEKDNGPLQAQSAKFTNQITPLRAKLIQARMAWKGSSLYPDANRTLRFTYGQVEPYSPRDGVHYDYLTSLGGVIEKETGEDPFIVPTKVKELWEKKDFGAYADPRLKDIPVAFIASLDITGGNSGSPVINGKGELIGVSFDGNWEAVVGDYVYQERLNRAINVDTRYILFLLDKFSNAQNLLDEMVIH